MGGNLARKNFMVDEEDVRALKQVLGAASESEAIRIAVRERLLLEGAMSALVRIRTRRGVEDVHRRSGRRRSKQSP